MQTQAALVGPDCRVELDAVATVHLDLAIIVHPRHAEDDDALRLHKALEDAFLLVLGMGIECRLERGEHLTGGLDELGLVSIALLQLCNHALRVVHGNPLSVWYGISCPASFL